MCQQYNTIYQTHQYNTIYQAVIYQATHNQQEHPP